MPRAILIDPGAEPVWHNLPNNVNAAVNVLLGPPDYDVIHRDTDRHGPGVQLAVYEWSLNDGSPHNDLATRIVAALGRSYHVHGRCLLLGLDGPETVDLTEAQWQHLTSLAGAQTTAGA